MKPLRLSLAVLAAPLALSLAACGSGEEDATSIAGEPVAEVPPPEGQAWFDVVAETPEGGWLVGNPEAPIKVVEYGSLTCPACASFSQTGMEPLRTDYIDSGRVNFELRSIPLHGSIDLLLTRVLECAPKEAAVPLAEQVWANLDTILDGVQQNAGAIEQAMSLPEEQRFVQFAQIAGLDDFFAARGVSTEQLQQCLSDFPAIASLAEQIQGAADEDEVTGTPTFYVNGQKIDGTRWVDLEPILQNAGAR